MVTTLSTLFLFQKLSADSFLFGFDDFVNSSVSDRLAYNFLCERHFAGSHFFFGSLNVSAYNATIRIYVKESPSGSYTTVCRQQKRKIFSFFLFFSISKQKKRKYWKPNKRYHRNQYKMDKKHSNKKETRQNRLYSIVRSPCVHWAAQSTDAEAIRVQYFIICWQRLLAFQFYVCWCAVGMCA